MSFRLRSCTRGQLYAHTAAIVLLCVFAVIPHIAFAQEPSFANAVVAGIGSVVNSVATPLVKGLAEILLQISSYFLGFAGIVLNETLSFTVVNMAATINDIDGINIAWTVIRDIINISFIFMILYAAISTILDLGGNWKKTVKNVVIAAVLINFSLFFTKVIIDASNIIALALHDTMVPATCRGIFDCGLSDSFMQVLGISGFYGVQNLPDDPIATAIIGIMGSIFILIAAFIFLMVSVLFLVRFVTLVFVLIFSPVGMFGSFLPGVGSMAGKWWSTLIGQAVFAPLYMLLTWVVLVIAGGLNTALVQGRGNLATAVLTQGIGASAATGPSANAVPLILNYIILIAFLIMSIVISRSYAQQGFSNYAQKLVGGVLGGSMGAAAWTGRKTLGKAGQWAMETDKLNLKERAANGSVAARMALRAGNVAANSSFDVRSSRILSKGESAAKTLGMGGLADVGLDMKGTGKGGYSKAYEDRQKDLIKKYEDRGKLLEPKTEAEKEALKKRRQAEFEEIKTRLESTPSDSYEEGLARDDFTKQASTVEAEITSLKSAPIYDATGAVIDPDRKTRMDDLERRKKDLEERLANLEENKKNRVKEEQAKDRARFEAIGGLNQETVKDLQAKIDSSTGKDKEESEKALKKYKEEQEQKKKDAESGKDRVIRYAEELKASNRIGNMPVIGIGSARKEARTKFLGKLKKKSESVEDLVKKALKENKEIAEKPPEEPAKPSA
jgi:hypothetical protein